ARGEVDLESRDAAGGARGGADLSRKVRKGREVVADVRGGGGEAVADELHAVTGIAGEPDDDRLWLLRGGPQQIPWSNTYYDLAESSCAAVDAGDAARDVGIRTPVIAAITFDFWNTIVRPVETMSEARRRAVLSACEASEIEVEA